MHEGQWFGGGLNKYPFIIIIFAVCNICGTPVGVARDGWDWRCQQDQRRNIENPRWHAFKFSYQSSPIHLVQGVEGSTF